MRLFYIFLSLALIIACRTSKSSVIKEKVSIEKSELKNEKFDSISKIDKIKKIDNSFQSQWFEFWNKYDASFNGTSNEDTFELTFTENGFTAKGKGSVNLKSETNKKDAVSNNKVDEITNEKADVKKNGITEIKSEENQSKIDKDKQNESRGFNWNFTILLIVVGVVSLVLLWKFGLPKLKKG